LAASSGDGSEPQRQPIFNLPPVTTWLLVANVAIHLVRMLLPTDLDAELVSELAFTPSRYTVTGEFGWTALIDPLTYQFLHGSLAHIGMNMLALLAFGSGVERRIGGARMLVFALICGIAAAATHFAVYPTSPDPVIGFSGALSGLFGGILRFIAKRGGTRLWPMIAVFLVMTIVTGETGMGAEGEIVAWVAHIGGFVAGLVLFGLFDREPA
jgi:membrane associated rhomboid family serine protease